MDSEEIVNSGISKIWFTLKSFFFNFLVSQIVFFVLLVIDYLLRELDKMFKLPKDEGI